MREQVIKAAFIFRGFPRRGLTSLINTVKLIIVMMHLILLALLFVFPGPYLITRMAIQAQASEEAARVAGWACLSVALFLSLLVWLQFGYLLMTWKLTSIAAAVLRFYYYVALAVPLPGLLQVGLACATACQSVKKQRA